MEARGRLRPRSECVPQTRHSERQSLTLQDVRECAPILTAVASTWRSSGSGSVKLSTSGSWPVTFGGTLVEDAEVGPKEDQRRRWRLVPVLESILAQLFGS